MPSNSNEPIRRPAKVNCYIRSCRNKAAIWIVRRESTYNSSLWVEAKVCLSCAGTHTRAKSQRD